MWMEQQEYQAIPIPHTQGNFGRQLLLLLFGKNNGWPSNECELKRLSYIYVHSHLNADVRNWQPSPQFEILPLRSPVTYANRSSWPMYLPAVQAEYGVLRLFCFVIIE